MDYFKQAFAISYKDKQAAEQLYKEAVTRLVNKQYVAKSKDAHTELSAIFSERWARSYAEDDNIWFNPKLLAQANNAFNYANAVLGARGNFEKLATQLVAAGERVNNETLIEWGEQMNCWLMCTKTEDLDEFFSFS